MAGGRFNCLISEMTNWTCKPFNLLKTNELYDLLQLRQAVFVVEQNCAYLDADGRDEASWHVLGHDEKGRLVACTRLLPVGLAYEKYASIGRVATSELARGTGLGRELMLVSIAETRRIFGDSPVKISAQSHLQKFYGSLGFEPTGDEYLEDDIPHIAMILK